MGDRNINIVRAVALKQGLITDKNDIQISRAANKRFAIKWQGKTVNFGLWPFQGEGTFIDHRNDVLRKAWQARHSVIKMKDGQLAYKTPGQPEYFSWRLLW